RQRYENTLEQSSALAVAAANLSGAGIAEEQVLRDLTGPAATRAHRQAAAAFSSAASTATSLAKGDPPSLALLRRQIAAEATARKLAASDQLVAATGTSGPLA